MVIEYLRKRGLKSAEQELRESLNAAGPSSSDVRPITEGRTTRSRAAKSKATTVTATELVKKNAPSMPRSGADPSNILADPSASKQAVTYVVNSMVGTGLGASGLSNLINAVGGVEDALTTGPTDRHDGFRELEAWVDGSLDMYRVRVNLPATR